MRTRSWILLLAAVALALGAVLVWQLLPKPAKQWAEVWSDGMLVRRVDLSQPQRFRVPYGDGYNELLVENGTIRVVEADCPGNDCVRSGARASGTPIVCLPHRLVIRFTDTGGVDAKTG